MMIGGDILKNKKVLILLIALFIIVLSITIYAAFFREKNVYDDGESPLKLDEKIDLISNIDYLNEYKDNVINDNNTLFEFDIILDKDSLYGKIYLDEEKFPHILNTKTNQDYKFMNIKFKTLDQIATLGVQKLEAYGITENGDVYRFILDDVSINSIKYYKMNNIANASKFTNLKVECYECSILGMVVLGDDNKMYDVDSGLLYRPDYKKYYDKYIVFPDDTITNYDGRRFLDFDGYFVEIAGFIVYEDSDVFLKNSNGVLIVAKDGFLMYLYDNNLYMFDKAAINIDNDYEKNTVNIEFFDKTKKSLKGYYKGYHEEIQIEEGQITND